MAFIRSVVRGVGAHLPKRIMTNDDLSRLVDTDDTWIRERTGIEQRHIADDGELTSDLGIAASRQALVRAGIDPVDIDLVVCATSTPDRTFPATGVRIQAGLGITKGAAFDVQAVCSGFVYALAIADNFLKSGQFKRAIVVGAETFSRILDGIAHRLGIPTDKIVYTLAKHGNTSAASIPLALNQGFEDHRLTEGRLVLMEAMGGGLTWGAALARW